MLKQKGAREAQKLRAAHAAGRTDFVFDREIYAHTTVKTALVDAQHRKCCFCESKVDHVSFGHVEHFRPKAGTRQKSSSRLQTPGYFWLAYDWRNLLFSCELCNSRFKRNLFPLANPSARATRPEDDLASEQPLFIDPSREDPTEHISFREEYPYAVAGSRRGNASWKALGLDREALAERRRERLKVVRALVFIRDGDHSSLAQRIEATSLLKEFASDAGEWSAMVRSALRAK